MAKATNHISSLKLNEIPTNFQTGVTVLKWPEDIRKPPVNNQQINIKSTLLILLRIVIIIIYRSTQKVFI